MKSKSKLLYDWQSVSQLVCLGIEHPCGTCDQILFPVWMLMSEICFLVSMGLPLWREGGSAICSVITQWPCLIWDSPNLEGQVPVFISPRNIVAQLYPRALGLTEWTEASYRISMLMSWGGPKSRHLSQQFMYCCDCWLPWKFCLSGYCLDTDLRNRYLPQRAN
jgi:hypothetical protein